MALAGGKELIDDLRQVVRDVFYLGRAEGRRSLLVDSQYASALCSVLSQAQLQELNSRAVDLRTEMRRRLRDEYMFQVTVDVTPTTTHVNEVQLHPRYWLDSRWSKFHFRVVFTHSSVIS
jgi:hypothetical protein